jgi:hypothetical protein
MDKNFILNYKVYKEIKLNLFLIVLFNIKKKEVYLKNKLL